MAEAQDLHSDDQDVEALFNSIVDKNSSGSATEDFVTDTNEDDTPDQDGIDNTNDANDDAPEEQPTHSEAVATEPTSEEGQSETGDEDNSDDDSVDIFEGLSKEQRAYIENLHHDRNKLQNDVRANAGRVSALNKKLDGLLKDQQEAPSGSGQPEQMSLDGKSFQEVEEEWPEVAEFVRAHVQQAVQHVSSGFQRELAPLRERADRQDFQDQANATRSELDRLRDHHSDYSAINQSEEFTTWIASKPQSIQALRNSMSADDNIELLNLYKFERGLFRSPEQNTNSEEPETSGASNVDLSEHAELPRQGAGQVQGLPNDLDALFDLAVSRRRS